MPSRPSWRPLVAGTVALFLVILTFLAGQLKAGGDPALGRSATPQQTSQGQTDPDDGFVPGDSTPAPTTHQS